MNSKKDFSHLIEVYKKTKKDENFFINTQSEHWESRYKGKNKFYNLENLINFRKNQVLSNGLDDAMNMQNIVQQLIVYGKSTNTHINRNARNCSFNYLFKCINFVFHL